MAGGKLDPLATQRAAGHDQRVTDADAHARSGRRLRLIAAHPQ